METSLISLYIYHIYNYMLYHILSFILFSFLLYILSKKGGRPPGAPPMGPPLKCVIVMTVIIYLHYRETN